MIQKITFTRVLSEIKKAIHAFDLGCIEDYTHEAVINIRWRRDTSYTIIWRLNTWYTNNIGGEFSPPINVYSNI